MNTCASTYHFSILLPLSPWTIELRHLFKSLLLPRSFRGQPPVTMMALNSLSPLSVNSLLISSSSTSMTSDSHSKPFSVACQLNSNRDHCEERRKSVGCSTVAANAESGKWGKVVSATLAAAVIAFSSDMSALADLNKFEAEMRGEFGIGSAAQFGSADLRLVYFIPFYLCGFINNTFGLSFRQQQNWIVFANCFAGKQCMWMKISGNFLFQLAMRYKEIRNEHHAILLFSFLH